MELGIAEGQTCGIRGTLGMMFLFDGLSEAVWLSAPKDEILVAVDILIFVVWVLMEAIELLSGIIIELWLP